VADEVATLEYELCAVRRMRAQLPAADHRGPIVLVGPADLLRELVRGTLRYVVDALSDSANALRLGDRDACQRLVETARAASDWAQTVADCHELEFFKLDLADAALRHSTNH
jgi:hypothetical protein